MERVRGALCSRCRRAQRRAPDQRLCARCHADTARTYRAKRSLVARLTPAVREAVRCAIELGAPTVIQPAPDGSLRITRLTPALPTLPPAPPRPAARAIPLVRA